MNLSTLSLKRLVQLAILRSRQVEAVKMCKSERSSAACTHAQSKVQRSENNKTAVCRTGQEQLLYIEVLVQSAVVSVKHKDNSWECWFIKFPPTFCRLLPCCDKGFFRKHQTTAIFVFLWHVFLLSVLGYMCLWEWWSSALSVVLPLHSTTLPSLCHWCPPPVCTWAPRSVVLHVFFSGDTGDTYLGLQNFLKSFLISIFLLWQPSGQMIENRNLK